MAEIVDLNTNTNTNTNKERAIGSAKRVINFQVDDLAMRRAEFEKVLLALKDVGPESGAFDELGVLLALPEEEFALIAPIFLDEYERGVKNINDQLFMIQTMNATGMKLENYREQQEALCAMIDEQMAGLLSRQKRDFLKRVLSASYNALAEADGVAKKTLLVPIEYCHDNAKMPEYAHLTDSGMDIFALEDIVIAPGETKLIPTGLKVAIPAGYELQVRPKSGRCLKTKLRIANTPGTIDAGYRDEIGVIVDNIEPFIRSAKMDETGRLYEVEFGSSYTIGKGEKFAQLVLCEVPKAAFYQVESVGAIENDGRNGGFGSSGLV